jgi:hypothetical protein
MAPELYTKNHAHNNTAEWFSVGVVVHEFLLSVRPYNEDKYKVPTYLLPFWLWMVQLANIGGHEPTSSETSFGRTS